MNLVENGTEAVVGLLSGAGDQVMAPVNIAGLNLSTGAMIEAAALLIGGGLQAFSPQTMPTFSDGLAASGIFGLARRVGEYGGAAIAGKPAPGSFARAGNSYGAVAAASYRGVNSATARGQSATMSDLGLRRIQ